MVLDSYCYVWACKGFFLPPKMVLDAVPSTLGLHLQSKVPKPLPVEVSQLHVILTLVGSWWRNGLLSLIRKHLPIPPLHLSLD
jgi:hypothetical protein